MIIILTRSDLVQKKSIDLIDLNDFILMENLRSTADLIVFVDENGQKKILKNRFGDLDSIPAYVDQDFENYEREYEVDGWEYKDTFEDIFAHHFYCDLCGKSFGFKSAVYIKDTREEYNIRHKRCHIAEVEIKRREQNMQRREN